MSILQTKHSEREFINRLENNLFDAAISMASRSPLNQTDNICLVGSLFTHGVDIDKINSFLLENPDLAIKPDSQGNTPLYYAVNAQSKLGVRLLKKYGVDITADINGFGNALHIACRKDNPSFIEFLHSMKIDHNMLNSSGHTPEDVARRWACFENLSYLESLDNPRLAPKKEAQPDNSMDNSL